MAVALDHHKLALTSDSFLPGLLPVIMYLAEVSDLTAVYTNGSGLWRRLMALENSRKGLGKEGYSQLIVGMDSCIAHNLIHVLAVSFHIVIMPTKSPREGGQTEWFQRTAESESVPASKLDVTTRPFAHRNFQFKPLNINKSVFSQNLWSVVVVCYRTTPVSGGRICQVLVIPLSPFGINGQSSVVAARLEVNLDLLDMTHTRFQMATIVSR